MLKITEEFITKSIIDFLKSKNYKIIAFDFPQSGTGLMIHPNDYVGKIEDAIIPDIIAKKGKICLIIENKDRYYEDDFNKLNNLREGDKFSNALQKFKQMLKILNIIYGIGIPFEKKVISKALKKSFLVDFIIVVKRTGLCTVLIGDI